MVEQELKHASAGPMGLARPHGAFLFCAAVGSFRSQQSPLILGVPCHARNISVALVMSTAT